MCYITVWFYEYIFALNINGMFSFLSGVAQKVAQWKARKEAILAGETPETSTISETDQDIYAVKEDVSEYQAVALANVNLSSVKSSDIHLKII